jgi:hypothetical protein
MKPVNRYFSFSKISEAKFRHLVRCFADDLTATETARRTGLSIRSVNTIFLRIRKRLAEAPEIKNIYRDDLTLEEVWREQIPSEWGSRVDKFRGIHEQTAWLHERETAFRYLHSKAEAQFRYLGRRYDLYIFLLDRFRKNPLGSRDRGDDIYMHEMQYPQGSPPTAMNARAISVEKKWLSEIPEYHSPRYPFRKLRK